MDGWHEHKRHRGSGERAEHQTDRLEVPGCCTQASLHCAACFSARSLQIFIHLAALSICVSNLAHTIIYSCCSSGNHSYIMYI